MSGGNKNRWSRTTGKKQRAISHDHEPPAAQSRALTPPFRNSPYARPGDAKTANRSQSRGFGAHRAQAAERLAVRPCGGVTALPAPRRSFLSDALTRDLLRRAHGRDVTLDRGG